jgi:uncharacterized protein (TIGR00645 family)
MSVESIVERTLFASRWLLCPLYIGLALLLLLFSLHFFRELIDITIHAFSVTEQDLVVEAMTLIDLALAGGLVVMIMLSGYENYVSKLDIADAEKSISWLGKLDTGTLKLKVSATIVTISAVQLLKAYLEVNTVANDKLLWLVVIHLTFVVSALLLTVMDRLLGAAARH